MWINRIKGAVCEHGSHVRVFADDRWGISYVLSTLKTSEQSLIYLDLEATDLANSIRQGNRLSDAVFRGTGARLFGLGVPASYGLGLLAKSQHYLAPSVIVVNNAQFGDHLRSGLRTMADKTFMIIEIHPESEINPSLEDGESINPTVLRVQPKEAIDMFSTHLTDVEILDLLHATEGAYGDLIAAVNRRLSLPPPVRPVFGLQEYTKGSDVDSRAILDYLMRERRWMEAFDLAIRSSQFSIATDIVGQAGEAFFEAGLFQNFWDLIRILPDEVFADDIPAYWLLSVAITLSREDETKELLWRTLHKSEAPNLRALMACINPSNKALPEVERAFSVEKSIMTVRALTHCLTSTGRPLEGLRVALDNLSNIERFATPRELANYAHTIGRTLLYLGRYSAALEWVNWGLKNYEEARLKEELLRLSLVSAKAYYALLLGDLATSKSALSSVSLDRELLGIYTMEAVFSTAADLAMVSGSFDEAMELYSLNYRQSPREEMGYAAVDLVGAMIMCGMKDEARSLANECHNVVRGTHERNTAMSRLALGIANAHCGVSTAKDQLRIAIKYFSNTNDSVAITRAALCLAQVFWKLDQRDKATQVLLDVREHIGELGESGWRLLGLSTPESDELWQQFQAGTSHLSLKFLGTQVASIDGEEHMLSLRNAEILALLAASGSGMSGEQLTLDLYGEGGSVKTLKSCISKLRQLVPITSRPYSLGTRYEADHVVIQRLISEGRTAEALDMYEGELIAGSEAPGIERLRDLLTESMRQAVLASRSRALLLQYCQKFSDDLEVVETLHNQLDPEDPQYASVSAILARIQREWHATH